MSPTSALTAVRLLRMMMLVATVAAAAAWQRCPAAVLAGCGRRWKVLRATPRRLRGAELLQRVFMRRLRRQQSDCIGVMKVNGSGNESLHACLEPS